jgi:FtsP/CotA-like multicopper oxidase with cupredoxin domain
MSLTFSRRHCLLSALATGMTAGALPAAARQTPFPLTVSRRTIEVLGRPAEVFGLRGPAGPGLVLDPGQRFLVEVRNQSGEDTVIHWHGQTPSLAQDGVTDTGHAVPIADGAVQQYDFAARPGTHWMHSHHGLQEQALLAAPLVVRTEEDLRADAQEVTVLLHDFSFLPPAEVLATVTGGAMAHGSGPGSQGAHAGHGGRGQHGAAMPMDLNDFDYDAYLANDRTLDDPLVVRAERGGRVRLRLINGATSTAFWIDTGALEATLLAVDGNPVAPRLLRRVPLAQGQRVDLLLTLPRSGGAFPIVAQREGDRQRTGVILASPDAPVRKLTSLADASVGPIDLSLELGINAISGLGRRVADARHRVLLTGSMQPYAWTLDDRSWGRHRALKVRAGQRVEIEMVNRSQMAHPMHLHGHHFQVVAIDGRRLSGAMRDTVLVPVKGSVTIAFDADNPGRWLFHCHNLFHMAAGMMTEITYADIS